MLDQDNLFTPRWLKSSSTKSLRIRIGDGLDLPFKDKEGNAVRLEVGTRQWFPLERSLTAKDGFVGGDMLEGDEVISILVCGYDLKEKFKTSFKTVYILRTREEAIMRFDPLAPSVDQFESYCAESIWNTGEIDLCTPSEKDIERLRVSILCSILTETQKSDKAVHSSDKRYCMLSRIFHSYRDPQLSGSIL